jgi:hypothetical protein
MKYLKHYKLFESLSDQKEVTIEEFLQKSEVSKVITKEDAEKLIKWWNDNRSHIKIFLIKVFYKPIMGGIIEENTIFINNNAQVNPLLKLFILFHESRHIDQHNEGRFEDGYYNSVVNGDKDLFLKSYKELEEDANTYALNSLKEIGIDGWNERMLRGNENMGNMVYDMMKKDIETYKPKNFYELIEKQIF